MISIAIIEDQPEIREGLAEVFKQHEAFECVGAFECGEAALEGLSDPLPDVILLDLQMPGINGVQTLQGLRKISESVKVIIYTVFDTDEKVFEALKGGAAGYILKREPPEKIIAAIYEMLDGGAPMSREIARKVLHSLHDVSTNNEAREPILDDQETTMLQLLSKGYQYKEIAAQLGLSLAKVKNQLHYIYEKLQVQNRTEAVNTMAGINDETQRRNIKR